MLELAIRTTERRAKQRFVIEAEVRYSTMPFSPITEVGKGRSRNISSGGVCFTTEKVLMPGTPVEVSIAWPALSPERGAIRLVIFGSVIRREGREAVVGIERYEFSDGTKPAAEPDPKVQGSRPHRVWDRRPHRTAVRAAGQIHARPVNG
jgi:hypothetical protein